MARRNGAALVVVYVIDPGSEAIAVALGYLLLASVAGLDGPQDSECGRAGFRH